MSVSIEGVTVEVARDEEDPRKQVFNVTVASKVKPGVLSSVTIDPALLHSVKGLIDLVGVSAASGAEYLGEKYNDTMEPADAQRWGVKALGEEIRMLELVNRDIPAKVKRLENLSVLMRDNDRERLLNVAWCLKHGCKLTPKEVSWVNHKTAEIHKHQV